jgi:hypothetical protein
VDTEVAAASREASSDEVQVSRLAVEVLASPLKEAAVSRVDVEVAASARESSGDEVQLSRIALEALARRGSSGPVVPLDLAAGVEVFLHNWATELRLNSSYLTDVATSAATGAESRRGLILKPDRSMRCVWESDDRTRLDRMYVMLRKMSDERINVPLYCDQRELDAAYTTADDTLFFDTSKGRWFVGARVVIVRFDSCAQYLSHEFGIIADLEDDRIVLDANLSAGVPVGSVVMPMMDMEIVLKPKLDMTTALVNKLTVEFSEVPGASALPPVKADFPSGAQTFQDWPIFDVDPDWIRGIKKGRDRQGRSYTQGRARRVFAAADRSRQTHELFLSGDRDEMFRVVEFFDTRRGRLRTFWLTDFEFVWQTAEIDASGAFVGVSELGDFDDFKDELEGAWIGLVMEDGTVYVREVVTVQQVLTVFRCTVNPALPAGLNATDVVRIARARFTRFESDEMEESWKHTGYMSTRLRFIEALNEKDVPTQ